MHTPDHTPISSRTKASSIATACLLMVIIVASLAAGNYYLQRTHDTEQMVLGYLEALNRRDTAAMNTFLASTTPRWSLQTRAEELEPRCLKPEILRVDEADTMIEILNRPANHRSPRDMAVVQVQCERSRTRSLLVVFESGVWKLDSGRHYGR